MAGCATERPLTQNLVNPDPAVVMQTKLDLVNMGPQAVPPLASAARSENAALRIQAIMTLGTVGSRGEGAASPAARALADILMSKPDREIRDYAVTALHEIGLAALPTLAQIAAANRVAFVDAATSTPAVEVVAAMMSIDVRHTKAQFIDMLKAGKGSTSNIMNILRLLTKQNFDTVPEWLNWWQNEGFYEGVDLTK